MQLDPDDPERRPRIAFFSDRPPERMEPYMRGDYELLSELGRVVWATSRVGPGWRRGLGPTGWLPTRAMLKLVCESDLVFQWFATPVAPVVAARLCRTPAIVVAGGYDVAAVKEIGYGLMLDRRTRTMGTLTLRLADRVLAFSDFAQREVKRWAPGSNVGVAYLGLRVQDYPRGEAPARPQVVTVGAICHDYLERKGLTTFARTSRLLPDVAFVLVGKHLEPPAVTTLRELGGENLKLTGYLSDAELRSVLRESAVYAQLSRHEGFGYAVAEAMLSGCTPVVTTAGALPEVVGDSGLVIPPDDVHAAAKAISSALSMARAESGRNRIAQHFAVERRQELLRLETSALLRAAGLGDRA
jgi:glycosyltransferase involved in cell wall biosynthesis